MLLVAPALKMGTTFASFNSDGNTPSLSDLLMTCVKGII